MPETGAFDARQQCGRTAARPMGRCPQCGAWNSMLDKLVIAPAKPVHTAGRGLTGASTPVQLTEMMATPTSAGRYPSASSPACWVGGIVRDDRPGGG